MTQQQWDTIERSLKGLSSLEKKEVADRILKSIQHDEASSARVRQQRESLTRLCATIDEMPSIAQGEGFTNRDHDRLIYER